jgi:putative ABC transport system permease protein
LEMKLFRGRWFSREEVQSEQFVAVINRRLARDLFGESDPVGRELRVKGFGNWKTSLQKAFAMKAGGVPQDTNLRIVGVVNDVKNAGPQQPAVPMAFVPPLITGAFILQVKTRVAPAALMHEVQEAVWAVDRDEVFWVFDPLEDFLQEHTYAVPEFGVAISGPLAGLTLLLVMMGVSSIMAYSVSLRTQEIGVRMALGAQRRDILGMVVRSGAGLILAGVVLGLGASWGLMRFLGSQIWGVEVTDSLTFAIAGGAVLAAGVVACVLPARRAAGLDPLVALRYE